MENTHILTIQTTIDAPVEKVWRLWNGPEHIKNWNNASDDWHTPHAEVDLRPGGRFLSRMEAKDGSWGFDFAGEYTTVDEHKKIAYTMDDGRKVEIHFSSVNGHTAVTESFEPETTHSLEMQQAGWQSILDNFKRYTEKFTALETLHFETLIAAPVEKVYEVMLADKTYRQWTSVFCEVSYYEGSWDKGSKILFVGEDAQGNKGGMVARIRENIPHRFVSIEHRGMFENGIEILEGPKVDAWIGCQENYAFSEENGRTRLKVSLDVGPEYKQYFIDTWPKALDLLKQLCEV